MEFLKQSTVKSYQRRLRDANSQCKDVQVNCKRREHNYVEVTIWRFIVYKAYKTDAFVYLLICPALVIECHAVGLTTLEVEELDSKNEDEGEEKSPSGHPYSSPLEEAALKSERVLDVLCHSRLCLIRRRS